MSRHTRYIFDILNESARIRLISTKPSFNVQTLWMLLSIGSFVNNGHVLVTADASRQLTVNWPMLLLLCDSSGRAAVHCTHPQNQCTLHGLVFISMSKILLTFWSSQKDILAPRAPSSCVFSIFSLPRKICITIEPAA